MAYPCKLELEEYRKVIEKLWEAGINPRRASSIIRSLERVGKLSDDVFKLFIEYRRKRRELFRCLSRYYARTSV